MWFGDRERGTIVSVASDGSSRPVARLGARAEPDLLATGRDGSVWFGDTRYGGLGRVLPDGSIEAMRFRRTAIEAGAMAPNGDSWFVRVIRGDTLADVRRTELVRFDVLGRVTRFRAPVLNASSLTVAADGTVWFGGLGGLVHRASAGRFVRVRRATGFDDVGELRAAPDGRVWLIFGFAPVYGGFLPPNYCLSQRQTTLRLHSRRDDPIRIATVAVQGQPTRTFRGPNLSIPVDLRGYLPGAVRVTIRVRAEHRRYVRKRNLYAAC